jgi:hypothetical protein
MRAEDFQARLDAAFRSRGYEVSALAGAAPGAADLLVVRGAERCLVQRTHWQSWQVGESVIRELADEVRAQQLQGGFVVTGGWFSREARELAAESGIELVDGDALGAWFGVRAAAQSPTSRAARAVPATVPIPPGRRATAAPSAQGAPACPKCGGSMQRQQATRGKMQGKYYWACVRQPQCLGILACRTEPNHAGYGAALTH